MKILPVVIISMLLMSGCGQNSNSVESHYVSPMEYRGYNCQQIELEMVQTSNRAKSLAGAVDKRASEDTLAVAGGFLISWPMFFMVQGDSPKAKYYARLKGEFDALEKASEQKECAIEVSRFSLEEAQAEQ